MNLLIEGLAGGFRSIVNIAVICVPIMVALQLAKDYRLMERVATLVGSIATTAHEQAAGIAQVHQAVGQIDQMTQQNAALVEESAAAADSLREQAQRLAAVVGQFTLRDDAGAGRSLPWLPSR